MMKFGITLLKYAAKMTVAGVVFTLVSSKITEDTYHALRAMRKAGEL